MKHPHHLLLGLASICALAACTKDEAPEVDLGYDYFPKNIGHWIEYQVDSMRVHLVSQSSNNLDTTIYSYTLREEIAENITDGEGRPAQRIIRYTRDENGNWMPKDVWWQTRGNVRAERAEENMLRVKLVFPPRDGTEWDTNAGNADEEFGLTYEDIDQPFSVNGLNFEKTVSVISTFENNLINTRDYEERYAKGVGMIVHVMDSINSNGFIGNWDLYERFYVRYAVTSYGN